MFNNGDKVYIAEFHTNGSFDKIIVGWVGGVTEINTDKNGTRVWYMIRHGGVQTIRRDDEVFLTEKAAEQYAYMKVRKVAAAIYNTVAKFSPHAEGKIS